MKPGATYNPCTFELCVRAVTCERSPTSAMNPPRTPMSPRNGAVPVAVEHQAVAQDHVEGCRLRLALRPGQCRYL